MLLSNIKEATDAHNDLDESQGNYGVKKATS
jgi:hypothetical protein